MNSSQTPYLNLPQFTEATDVFSFEQDWNDTMDKIDTAYENVQEQLSDIDLPSTVQEQLENIENEISTIKEKIPNYEYNSPVKINLTASKYTEVSNGNWYECYAANSSSTTNNLIIYLGIEYNDTRLTLATEKVEPNNTRFTEAIWVPKGCTLAVSFGGGSFQSGYLNRY